MSLAFSRSLEAIRAADQRHSLVGLAVATVLLGAWLAWFSLARVIRYQTSEEARVEVDQTAHRVAAPVAGRVWAVHLELDTRVKVGDVLVELDDHPLRLELTEKTARLAAVAAQIAPIRREIAAREQVLREAQQAGRAQVDEARARAREAEATAHFLAEEASRALLLRSQKFLSESEASRAAAEAQSKRAMADAEQLSALRTDAEQRSRGGMLAAELAGLQRQAAALEGERATLEAALDTLGGEIERRKIRAPIDGRIGEVRPLRTGSFLKEGDAVATIVPIGTLRIVAEFPVASVGRLAAGQPARMRLDAFPWTEFGTVRALVQSIGTEAQQGRVRVELAVQPDRGSPIPMQHGLPGTVIVAVERVSPATLVLRAAGQLLQTRHEVGP